MCVVKLDMSKAYDKMGWNFLKAILLKMNFPHIFINMVLQCISTVTYTLLLNGHKVNSFAAQRGVRQGDPLSPYLFILGANVLSAMLHKAEKDHLLQGICFARRGPKINHLMYDDDVVLFFQSFTASLLLCH